MLIKTHLELFWRSVQAIRLFFLREDRQADALTPPLNAPQQAGSGHEATTNGAAAPHQAAAPPEPGVVIGSDLTTGREVTIPPLAHTGWIVGASGTGKTTLLSNLILSDIKKGRCIGLLEPHGDLTQTIIAGIPEERLKDVVYLDLEDWQFPYGLNLFECPPGSTIRTQAAAASLVAHAFEKIWGLGVMGTDTPRLMQNIRAFTRTLIDNPGTAIAEAPLLYAFEPVRRRLLSRVQNPQIHLFWEQYAQKNLRDMEIYTESTLNKVNAFLDEPMIRHILAQARTTVNWREVMDTGKILLIKLSPQFEEASTLIGSIIIG